MLAVEGEKDDSVFPESFNRWKKSRERPRAVTQGVWADGYDEDSTDGERWARSGERISGRARGRGDDQAVAR